MLQVYMDILSCQPKVLALPTLPLLFWTVCISRLFWEDSHTLHLYCCYNSGTFPRVCVGVFATVDIYPILEASGRLLDCRGVASMCYWQSQRQDMSYFSFSAVEILIKWADGSWVTPHSPRIGGVITFFFLEWCLTWTWQGRRKRSRMVWSAMVNDWLLLTYVNDMYVQRWNIHAHNWQHKNWSMVWLVWFGTFHPWVWNVQRRSFYRGPASEPAQILFLFFPDSCCISTVDGDCC